MATEDNLDDLKSRLREDEYEKLRLDNERLRMKCIYLENRHPHLDINVSEIIRWVENHYLFCIVALLALSYLGSFLIEAQQTRRTFRHG